MTLISTSGSAALAAARGRRARGVRAHRRRDLRHQQHRGDHRSGRSAARRPRSKGFARQVERIIADGGGRPRGSELLDGVFSFDRARRRSSARARFDVDRVSDDELHTIADTIRSRFGQQSVLTFDRLPAGDRDVDAIELDVPQRQRHGAARRPARRRRGARAAVRRLGHAGPTPAARRRPATTPTLARVVREARSAATCKRAETRYGEREFVDGSAAGAASSAARWSIDGRRGRRRDRADAARRPHRGHARRRRRSRSRASAFDRVRVDGGDGPRHVRDRRTGACDLQAAGDRVRMRRRCDRSTASRSSAPRRGRR